MNYRFRVSEQKKNPSSLPMPLRPPRRYKLKGRNTLRALREEAEPIRLSTLFEQETLPPPSKKQRKAKKVRKARPRRHPFRAAGRALRSFGDLLREGFAFWWKLLRPAKKKRKSTALPMLAGALCAAILVISLSAGTVAFHFLFPYHRAFTPRTIPDFVGKAPSDVLTGDELSRWNLIITYAYHSEIPEGQVISQSPPAGVVRRVYEKNGYPTVTLTVSRGTHQYTLEELSGRLLRDARLLLQNQGMTVTVREIPTDKPSGTVLGSIPAAGSTLQKGDHVLLQVSKTEATSKVTVPNLIGMSEVSAAELLAARGLLLGSVSYATSQKPAGTVIAQTPSAYIDGTRKTEVSYTVSAGNSYALRTLPDLCGLSRTEAAEKLREYGLVVGSVTTMENAAPDGTVLSQFPKAGVPITSSTVSVDLYLSK